MKKQSEIIYQNQSQKQEPEQKPSVPFCKAELSRKAEWRKRLGFLFASASLAGFAFFISPYMAGKMAQNKRKGFGSIISNAEVRNTEVQKKTEDTENFRNSGSSESQSFLPQLADQYLSPAEKLSKITSKPQVKNFLLTIERIGLHSALVIPEIDANDTSLYERALRYGLVHAQNSALPDQSGMIYIFGHSTNYPWLAEQINALFFQIEKVDIGDKVKIEYNGEHFLYHVFDKRTVNPSELDSIKANINQDVLVLQSCYPPGTALKRLLIFARPSKMGALIY